MRAAYRGAIVVLVGSLLTSGIAFAQSRVTVEVDEVTDNRMGGDDFTGFLDLRVNIAGERLDDVAAARIIVKKATDDSGTDLLKPGDPPDFQARNVNAGLLNVTLKNPPRKARAVTLSGTVELFLPSKDPNARIKVDRALTKLDTPFTAKGLKSEKLTITPLSAAKYAEKQSSRKLDEAKIAEIRAQAKKEGVSDEELEAAIELAKAFEELGGGPLPEGAVVLSGTKADLDRLLQVRILDSSGEEVDVSSRSSSTTQGETIMILAPNEPPPADAALELTLITKKSTVSVPFELKNIPLP